MPRSRLAREVKDGVSVEELAGQFGVSKAAMEIRLKTLGLT